MVAFAPSYFTSVLQTKGIPVRQVEGELQGRTGVWLRTDYLDHPDSVQVRYRPFLQENITLVDLEPGDTTSEQARLAMRELRRSRQGWLAPDGVWFNPIAYWYFNHGSIDYKDDEGELHEETPLYSHADKEVLDDIWNCLIQTISVKGTVTDDDPLLKPIVPAGKKWTRKEKSLENKRRFALLKRSRQAPPDKLTLKAEDYIITKGRRKHWSYNTLCAVFLWAFCVDQNGNLGAGFDCKDSREEGQRILRGAYDRLHPFWKHKDLMTDREGQLSAAVTLVDEQTGKEFTKRGITIFFKEMDKRVGAFRGKNLRILLLDEAGKYLKLGQVIGASRDCLRVGQNKFGSMLIGGTCDPITNDSDAYQNQWNRALALGYSRRFIPAWKMAPPFVNWFTGENLEHLARKEYELERKTFLDAGDTQGHALTVQENPLDEFELFMLPTVSHYPPHQLLKATQLIAEYGSNLPVMRVRLEWEYNTFGKRTGRVYPDPDPNGKWLLHTDYQPAKEYDNLDVLGVDSVYKDAAPHSDSKCAAVLYRRFHHRLEKSDYPAMVYLDRPALDLFADEIKKVMVFTGCRAIIEDNDKYLADEIQKDKIPSERGPILLGDKLMWFNGQPGLRNSEQTIIAQTGLALKWMNDGGLRLVVFQIIIDALKNWRGPKNDDVASALHLALMGVDTLRETIMEEDDAKIDTNPLGMGFNNNLLLGAAVDLSQAFGYTGEGFAPLGSGNSAWGNPLRRGVPSRTGSVWGRG